MAQVQEDALLGRITVDPGVFGGKPIIRGRRLAVEHVLGMLAAGDSVDDLLREYRRCCAVRKLTRNVPYPQTR